MDTCIVSGFSLGASMSVGRIARHGIEFPGDIVGREGLRNTRLHLDAVLHWGDIGDAEGGRRFLGAFG